MHTRPVLLRVTLLLAGAVVLQQPRPVVIQAGPGLARQAERTADEGDVCPGLRTTQGQEGANGKVISDTCQVSKADITGAVSYSHTRV